MEKNYRGVLILLMLTSLTVFASAQNHGDLRLVGFEASSLSGVLEIYNGSGWTTICNDGFGLKEAAVACRQLGLGYPVTVFNQDGIETGRSRFGFGTKESFGIVIIGYTNVNCQGNETHLFQCSLSTEASGCQESESVGIQCSALTPEPYPGQIRLVDGSYPSEGLLEIYLNGEWGAVCGSIDQTTANTACRQLGYAGTATSNVVAGSSSAWITSVSCPSTQTCLTSCLSSVPTAKLPDCGSQNYTRINCSVKGAIGRNEVGSKELCSNITSTPPDGSLRLIGGSNSEGVVQIYKNEEWGTVCVFDFKPPEVICRQLGYTTLHNFGLIEFDWAGPIHVTAASCNGGENRLDECKLYNASQMECPSVGEHLYIICDISFSVQPVGSLTLLGGDGGSGDLYVKNGLDFLPICNHNFDRTAADVACRQLGYEEALAVRRGSYYSQFVVFLSNVTFAITNISCTGTESNILQCPFGFERTTECNESSIVGVQCNSKLLDINRGDLRLFNGNRTSGTLEMQLDGAWQKLCYNSAIHLAPIASVACRELGYFGVNQIIAQSGAPEYIILACTGDESRLYDCFHSPIWTGLCRGAIQLTCTDVISSTSVMSSTIRPAATTSSQPFSSPSPTVTVTPGIKVYFDPQNYTTSEGDGSVPLTIVVDKVPAKDVTVTVTTMDITAEDLLDFNGGSFNVTIPAGATTATVPVTIIEDGLFELAEYFIATLSIPGDQPDVMVGDPDVAYVTIAEGSVVVTWEQDMYMLTESDEYIVVTLNSSEPASFPYYVTVTAMDITAVEPNDYMFSSVVVTFPAGVTRVNISIPVIDDEIHELDETFKLNVTSGAFGVFVGYPDVTTILIKDDEVVTFNFERDEYNVTESDGSIQLCLVASHVSDVEINVTLQISNENPIGSGMDIAQAFSGSDFSPEIQPDMISFRGEDTRKCFNVTIINDFTLEEPETFTVTAHIASESTSVEAKVTILDDDVIGTTTSDNLRTTETLDLSSSFVQPTSSEISQDTTSSESYGSSVVTTIEVPSSESSSIPSSSAETTSSESYGSSVVTTSEISSSESISIPSSSAETTSSESYGSSVVTTSEVSSSESSSIPSSSAVLTPSPLPRTCPDTLIFTSTPVDETRTVRCSTLSDLLYSGIISARCGGDGEWESLDLSQCTFKELPNKILLLEATDTNIRNYSSLQLKNGTVYSVIVIEDPPVAEDGIVVTANNSCGCCENIINVTSPVNPLTFCVGSPGATSACKCSDENTDVCEKRYLLEGSRCTLDSDNDKIADYKDPCIECCQKETIGNITWPVTTIGQSASLPCSEIHSSFSSSLATRRCNVPGLWESVDISKCTFKNGTEENEIVVVVSESGRSDVKRFEVEVETSLKIQNVTMQNYTIEIVRPDNTSFVAIVTFLTQNVTAAVFQPVEGATVYTSSNDCSCNESTPVTSGGRQNLCIGTGISCTCSGQRGCMCVTPFVRNIHGNCEIDSDGDGIPDSEDKCKNKPGICDKPEEGEITCPPNTDQEWQLEWPEMEKGEVAHLRCPQREGRTVTGLAERRCNSDGTWGEVDVTACTSQEFNDIIIQAESLANTLNVSDATNEPLTETAKEVVNDITAQLSNVTEPVEDETILPNELRTTTFVLQQIERLGDSNNLFDPDSNTTNETIENIADIVSNVLDENNKAAFTATNEVPVANQTTESAAILRTTEGIANGVGRALTPSKPTITLSRPNFGFQGRRVNLRRPGGILFPGSLLRSNFGNQKFIPKLNIPSSFIKMAVRQESLPMDQPTTASPTDGSTVAPTTETPVPSVSSEDEDTTTVVNFVMNNMEDYLPIKFQDGEEEIEGDNIVPGTLVVSSQIGDIKVPSVPENFTDKVIIEFNVKDEVLNGPVPSGKRREYTCVFWNPDANKGTGGWSRSGVARLNFTETENGTQVTCETVHLTSFVVLVSLVDTTLGEPLAFDVLTYIGCGISIFFLIISIIFFLCLKKELITKVHNYVHLNLCIALTLGLVVFLAGVDTATSVPTACKAVTTLMHYFFLSVFTWSLCEGVLIYNLLVKVFGANEKKWIYIYTALGWGLPIPAVVVSVAIRHEVYFRRASFDKSDPFYEHIHACWLPPHLYVIWAFIGPMILIVVVNAVLLFLSMASLAKNQCRKKANFKKGDSSNMKAIGKQLLRTIIILLPLFCFTWVIGLFAIAPGQAGQVFAILFIVANSLQGFFIFVLHVLRHEKVWGKIKAWCKCDKGILSTSSTGKASFGSRSTAKSHLYATTSVKSSVGGTEGMGLAVKQDDDAESIKDEDVQMKPISGGPEAKNGEPDNVAATSFGISNGESEMEKKSLGKEESKDSDKTDNKGKYGSTEDPPSIPSVTTFGIGDPQPSSTDPEKQIEI